MATNLKDALRRFVDDQTITADERTDLVGAGLIRVTGTYSVTELGRTMAIQNPGPLPTAAECLEKYGASFQVPPGTTVSTLPPESIVDKLFPFTNVGIADCLALKIGNTGGVLVNDPASVIKPVGTTPSPEFSGHLTGVSAKDVQVGGDHYKKLGHHQPWEVLATWMTPEELRGYMKGTVIAYLAREQEKGKDQDIEKALHTMQLWQDVRKDK